MISVCEATPNDIDTIRDLAERIWPAAYGKIISARQISYMLNLFYSDEKLNTDLQSGQMFLLAKNGSRHVGFAAIEHRWNGDPVTRIHNIYVLPDQQGKGIGKLLMQEIEKWAVAKRDTKLSLNVNRQNPAQEFYHHLGFEKVKVEDIDIGQGYLMEDFVMEKPLNRDSDSRLGQ